MHMQQWSLIQNELIFKFCSDFQLGAKPHFGREVKRTCKCAEESVCKGESLRETKRPDIIQNS